MKYGEFGGQYVPQQLKEKLVNIEKEFKSAIKDKDLNTILELDK